jgi:DNA-binding GntR family transcriptional regulator
MNTRNTANKPHQPEDSVDTLLRRGIREGRYVSGQRLIESDLQLQLGASQRQVRDALRQLENEGLVTIEKNRGATVRNISRQEVKCILDVLDSLSMLAVRQACEKIEQPECRRLIEKSLLVTIQFNKKAKPETKIHKFLDENVRFWDSIAIVVDNPFLWDIRERLETLLFRLRIQGLAINSDSEKWIMHHEEILTAILDKNVTSAERLVLKTSKEIRKALLELNDTVFNQ